MEKVWGLQQATHHSHFSGQSTGWRGRKEAGKSPKRQSGAWAHAQLQAHHPAAELTLGGSDGSSFACLHQEQAKATTASPRTSSPWDHHVQSWGWSYRTGLPPRARAHPKPGSARRQSRRRVHTVTFFSAASAPVQGSSSSQQGNG